MNPSLENNWLVKWWRNMRNTKKNFKKVQASPFAMLNLKYKVTKIIIIPLMIWLGYMTYAMLRDYSVNGFMNTVGKVVMLIVMGFVIWRLYNIIPQSKKQIDYYKKYPHLINYCPTDTKETIESIFEKIKQNQIKGGVIKNVGINKEETATSSTSSNQRSSG